MDQTHRAPLRTDRLRVRLVWFGALIAIVVVVALLLVSRNRFLVEYRFWRLSELVTFLEGEPAIIDERAFVTDCRAITISGYPFLFEKLVGKSSRNRILAALALTALFSSDATGRKAVTQYLRSAPADLANRLRAATGSEARVLGELNGLKDLGVVEVDERNQLRVFGDTADLEALRRYLELWRPTRIRVRSAPDATANRVREVFAVCREFGIQDIKIALNK